MKVASASHARSLLEITNNAPAPNNNGFGASRLSETGYQFLNGLLLQWGSVDLTYPSYDGADGATKKISFPVTYGRELFSVVTSKVSPPYAPNEGMFWARVISTNKYGFDYGYLKNSGLKKIYYIAIGR